MSLRFAVDLDDLEESIAQMEQCHGQLATHLDDLDATVAGLHATWTGEAALAQAASHARWAEGAREMHQALAAMAGAAQHARDSYSLAADTNATMWAGLW